MHVLTCRLSTLQYNLLNDKSYLFLNASIANVWTAQPGTDITGAIKELGIDAPTLKTNMDCIQTLFYVGETDFRDTPRCQVQPNLLLAFSILIMLTILVKFLAALQFGSKRLPEQRDKFVICASRLLPCSKVPLHGADLFPALQVKSLVTRKAKTRSKRPSTRSRRSTTTTAASSCSSSAMA